MTSADGGFSHQTQHVTWGFVARVSHAVSYVILDVWNVGSYLQCGGQLITSHSGIGMFYYLVVAAPLMDW